MNALVVWALVTMACWVWWRIGLRVVVRVGLRTRYPYDPDDKQDCQQVAVFAVLWPIAWLLMRADAADHRARRGLVARHIERLASPVDPKDTQ